MDPKRNLATQPWMTAPPVRAVMAALAAGGEARFVGGCVRDAVLCREVHDVDIATHLPPERVTAALQAAGIKAVPTGIAHGTVTAVTGDQHFEITTLRRDVATDGRRAEVAFTDDWQEDAARRDFTFNAMSMTETGAVYDYFDGLEDLAAGRVRFVGDPETRIREDVLRVLRFFRFHAFYGRGAPDVGALAAARKLAPLTPGLSGERVWAELSRILMAPDPAAAFALMADNGVLAEVLPEATNFARLGALAVIEAAEGCDAASAPVRRLAAVLAADAEGAEAVAARLRLSRHGRQRLVHLAEHGATVAPDWTRADARRAIYRHGAAPYRDTVLISWAGEKAEGANHGTDAAYSALLEVGASFAPPAFPLGGADAQALGLAPGPGMGAALAAVEAWWLAEDFAPDRAACLDRLRAVIAGR